MASLCRQGPKHGRTAARPLQFQLRCHQCLWERRGGGLTFSAAPALATAKLTPRIAFAPSFDFVGVPSCSFRNLSTADWSLTSMFSLINLGPRTSLTFWTALVTPNRYPSMPAQEINRCRWDNRDNQGFIHTLAVPATLVAVTELGSLMLAFIEQDVPSVF